MQHLLRAEDFEACLSKSDQSDTQLFTWRGGGGGGRE